MAEDQAIPPEEITLEALIGGARLYQHAAHQLLSALDTTKIGLDPVYMLNFHATELALKAFLVFRGEAVNALKEKWKHNVEKMYAEALRRGLDPEPAARNDLYNVIKLLQSGNANEAFRYFTFKSRSLPEIRWTGQVVALLIETVGKASNCIQEESGSAIKIDLVWGQPVEK